MRPRRERGFALLIVLWSLVLITLLTTQILAAGRTALALAANMRAAAQARAADDGAINEAIYHLLDTGAGQWLADDRPHLFTYGNVTLTVRVHSLAGTINPNGASTKLLEGFFLALGAPSGQAAALAQGIIAWRSPAADKPTAAALLTAYRHAGLPYGPPGRPFSDIGALRYVMGMTPEILARAMPYLNLHQSGDPDPAQAGPIIRQALAFAGQAGAKANVYNGNAPVVRISAEVDGPGKLAIRRVAIVSIAGANSSPPYQRLAIQDDVSGAMPEDAPPP